MQGRWNPRAHRVIGGFAHEPAGSRRSQRFRGRGRPVAHRQRALVCRSTKRLEERPLGSLQRRTLPVGAVGALAAAISRGMAGNPPPTNGPVILALKGLNRKARGWRREAQRRAASPGWRGPPIPHPEGVESNGRERSDFAPSGRGILGRPTPGLGPCRYAPRCQPRALRFSPFRARFAGPFVGGGNRTRGGFQPCL